MTPDKAEDKKREIKLLTIKNIERDGRINYKDVDYVSKDYFEGRREQMGTKQGDILVAITGATIGKVAIFNDNKEVGICGDIAKIRPKNINENVMLSSFLNSRLGQNQIKKYINGSTNFHLSIKDMDKIVVPKLGNQKAIDEVIKNFNKASEKLWELGKTKDTIDKWKGDIYSEIVFKKKRVEEYDKKIKEIIKFLQNIEKME